MSSRIPLTQLEYRPPEAGRIRVGVKESRNGKQVPKAISTFRFTSPEKDQIEALATMYGGDVNRWKEPLANPPDQWDVVTPANKILVWLAPDSLNTSYEHWTRAGCERRCDGITCTYNAYGTKEKVPCVCAGEEGRALCKAKSRLSVTLPGIPMSGVWRLDTQSEYFLLEAGGMVADIERLQHSHGLTKVYLHLTNRTKREGGKTSHYIVPKISLAETPEQILEGLASVTAVGPGAVLLALDKGPEPIDPIWHQSSSQLDDEVIDAEIIEFPRPSRVEEETTGWDKPPPGTKVRLNPRRGEPDQPRYIRKED